MVTEGRFQCPCCDYYTLRERAAFEICPVCYWEDDGQDMDRLDEVSGANHKTLRAARHDFASLGASDDAARALVAAPGEYAHLRRELRATYG